MGIKHNKIVSILNGANKDIFKPMDKDYAKSMVEKIL